MKQLSFTSILLCVTAIGCVALVIVCGGFGPGMADYTYDVSGGYHVVRSSAHQITVVPVKGWMDQTPIIPPKVVEIAWDETFVLAKQQHLRRAFPNNSRNAYEEPAPGQFSYWILNVKEPKVFGPLEEATFRANRIELRVPESLKLQGVESFVSRKWLAQSNGIIQHSIAAAAAEGVQ